MADWRISGFHEVRELGRGAQGRVVLARHATAGTPVAIKYLPAEADEAARSRFAHEARMLGQVRSPHVARLYQLVDGEHGSAIVMEAVNGASLKAVLAEHGALEPEAALTVLKGSLLGLAAAHAVGIVHRDYKPANVVVPADGRSKLIDFGIAAPAGGSSRAGTPYYMAPEQWQGEPASPATDVYAATCVFYECVTGRRPFEGDAAALADEHLTAPVPLADVPEPLRPLVAGGMAKHAPDRPPGAAVFVDVLERTAQAAYGNDWEDRGIRALAGAAVALAAVFPLVAAGLGGATAAGTTAAGTAGTSAAVGQGAGVIAKIGGAKAILAVAGTVTVVAVAGTAFVQRTGGAEKPRAAPTTPAFQPVNVGFSTQTYQDPAIYLSRSEVRYATVSGGRDPAVRQKINQALRRPVDDVMRAYREHWAWCKKNNSQAVSPKQLRSELDVISRGPRLLSIRHLFIYQVCVGGSTLINSKAVNVDLGTGRVLTPSEVFKTAAVRGAGLQDLSGRVPAPKHDINGYECGYLSLADQWSEPKARFSGVSLALAKDHAEFVFTPSEDCLVREAFKVISVPYGRISDLMRPETLALAKATTPP